MLSAPSVLISELRHLQPLHRSAQLPFGLLTQRIESQNRDTKKLAPETDGRRWTEKDPFTANTKAAIEDQVASLLPEGTTGIRMREPCMVEVLARMVRQTELRC